MKIYIQVAAIEDISIIHTVNSALQNASYPENIRIGIAATVQDSFFDSVIVPLKSIPNVKIKKFDPVRDRGLGKARINSRFAYDDEDYVLQIDCHTNFESGWDQFLISMFEEAVHITNNQKTLVTGYLGRYKMIDGEAKIIDSWAGYSVWPGNNVTPKVSLRSVAVTKIIDFPDNILKNKESKFYPSNRIAGNFIFGNKEWAKFHGWSGNEVFWEEEITPAITLLDNEFSLVFPNLQLPLTHLYWGDDLARQTMDDIFENPDDIDDLANDYIKKFCLENQHACKKYIDYAGYDLVTNTLTYKVFIPNSYKF